MPITSAYPSFEVPKVGLWEFLFERKDKPFPDDKEILIDPYTKRSYTYQQTKDTSIEFGKGLKSVWEWKKGDVLCLFTPNCIDTPPVMAGCLWAGGIVSPANPAYTVDELSFQLKDSGSQAIVTQMAMLDVAIKAAKTVGIPEDRIILVGDEKDKDYKFKHFSSIKNLAGTSRYKRTKVDPEKDLAFLPYSSGTTGRPKGVKLIHRNLTCNTLQINAAEVNHLTWKEDNLIGFLPFFHIYALTVLINQSLYAGYSLVVMPKFDLEGFCKICQDYKISMGYLVPPVVLQLAKAPIVEKYDLSAMKMINSGAAPLTRELVEAVWNRLKIPIKQGYGLSETSPTTHTQPWDRWRTTIGAIGTILPNEEAMYVDADGKELGPNEEGELWVRGPNIFVGYLNNEEGTRNAFGPDGWFKTGDVGYRDKDDNFYITDRLKELIKYKGFQVPPAELEGLLVEHDAVDDVAVIGVQDWDRASEVPRAYVVVKKGVAETPETEKKIVDWLAGKVTNHKQLRGGVRFVKEIPKSASGKILRRILKNEAAEEAKKSQKSKL